MSTLRPASCRRPIAGFGHRSDGAASCPLLLDDATHVSVLNVSVNVTNTYYDAPKPEPHGPPALCLAPRPVLCERQTNRRELVRICTGAAQGRDPQWADDGRPVLRGASVDPRGVSKRPR